MIFNFDFYSDATPLIDALNNEIGLTDSKHTRLKEYSQEYSRQLELMLQNLTPIAREYIRFNDSDTLAGILSELNKLADLIQNESGKIIKDDLCKAFRIKKAYFIYIQKGLTELFSKYFLSLPVYFYSSGFNTDLTILHNKTLLNCSIDIGQIAAVDICNSRNEMMQGFSKLIRYEMTQAENMNRLIKQFDQLQREKDYSDKIVIEDFKHNENLHKSLIKEDRNWERVSHYIMKRIDSKDEGNNKFYIYGIDTPNNLLKFIKENSRIPEISELIDLLPFSACCESSFLIS